MTWDEACKRLSKWEVMVWRPLGHDGWRRDIYRSACNVLCSYGGDPAVITDGMIRHGEWAVSDRTVDEVATDYDNPARRDCPSRASAMDFERATYRVIDKQAKQIVALTEELAALKRDAKDYKQAAEEEIRRLSAVARSAYYDSEEGQWRNRKNRKESQ